MEQVQKPSYLASKLGGKLAEVKSKGDVLVVHGEISGALANAVLVCSIVEGQVHVSNAVHEGSSCNWHMRFEC